MCENIKETSSFSKGISTLDIEEENDDTLVYIHNNCDGEYIDIGYEKKIKRKK